MIKIWDISTQTQFYNTTADGEMESTRFAKLIATLSPHQKTITCMQVVQHECGSFLVSGSLDHQVKMIDLSSYKIVGGFKYPAPILTLAMSVCFY